MEAVVSLVGGTGHCGGLGCAARITLGPRSHPMERPRRLLAPHRPPRRLHANRQDVDVVILLMAYG